MSVGLDWRIEDSDEQPSGADLPPEPPRRPWRDRRLWRWGRRLALLALIALIAGGVWLYATYRNLQDRRDDDLRRAVRLESRAYGEGDAELYSARQDPQDSAWLAYQRQWFDQRANWPATLPYTYALNIVSTGFEGDRAWAEIDETYPQSYLLGASPPATVTLATYRRVVFYRLAGSDWIHTAPRADSSAWGPPVTQVSGPYAVTFPARDAPAVEGWLAELGPFAERLCLDLACPADTRWTITVSPTLDLQSGLGFQYPVTDSLSLTVGSPSLTGYEPRNPLDSLQGFSLAFSTLAGAVRAGGGVSLIDGGGDRPYTLAAAAVVYWELHDGAGRLNSPLLRYFDDMIQQTALDPLHTLFSRGDLQPGRDYIPLAEFGARRGMPDALGFDAPQAYGLIEFVAERYGRGRFGDVLRAARTADSLGAALQSALNVQDLDAFERDWLAFGKRRFGNP